MCYRGTVDEEEESSSVHASNIPFFTESTISSINTMVTEEPIIRPVLANITKLMVGMVGIVMVK